MNVIEVYCDVKIYYASFFGSYIVLWPTKDGKSSMNRFEGVGDARKFIDKNLPSRWWQKDD